MNIGPYTFDEFLQRAADFHGYAAPGLAIGGYMVDLAVRRLPDGTLFEALVETSKCLPDAVQLLTPCSTGNGRLRVVKWGLYALSLYDKFTGIGVRVHVDPSKLNHWPEIQSWFLKLKAKPDQDSERLLREIEDAGTNILGQKRIQVSSKLLEKSHMSGITICPICSEAYPSMDGGICRRCQGEDLYVEQSTDPPNSIPDFLTPIPVEQAVGRRVLHDMTRIVPRIRKGPAFRAGQEITVGDICRLQQMGRNRIYVDAPERSGDAWLHENEAVAHFAEAMAGEGVGYSLPPSEGKINFTAERAGLFVVERDALARFNLVPNVMCACRQCYTVVEAGKEIGGCRAIPLFLSRKDFERAMAALDSKPLFKVLPMRNARVGILVTGTEVFQGLVEDKFAPIIQNKVEKLGCRVVGTVIVPDDWRAISHQFEALLLEGADLIVTTAGLSVDPDDVTLEGLKDAGVTDILYGAPLLPGAMTMVARAGKIQVMGVPACALFFKTTSFDLLLPRLLAGLTITRLDIAQMAEGGFCLNCRACTYPKCPFGK
jgi:formylmethanofuran dehydrogenase subunit E